MTVLLFVLFAAATGATSLARGLAADGAVTIVLREENGSGVTGSAILSAAGDRTVVGLIVRGTTGGLPTHLHQGPCRTAVPAPLFPLTDAFPGAVMTTTIDLPLSEVRGGGYAIVIHLQADDLGTLLDPASIVACGDIGGGDANGVGGVSGVAGMPRAGSGVGAVASASVGGSWSAAAGGLAFLLLVVGLGRNRAIGRFRATPS